MGSHQNKKLLLAKENTTKIKMVPDVWKNIFSNDTLDTGLISKIYKELTWLHSRKTNHLIPSYIYFTIVKRFFITCRLMELYTFICKSSRFSLYPRDKAQAPQDNSHCLQWADPTFLSSCISCVILSSLYFSQANKCFLKCSINVCQYLHFFLHRIPAPTNCVSLGKLSLYSQDPSKYMCSLPDSYYSAQRYHSSYFTCLLFNFCMP